MTEVAKVPVVSTPEVEKYADGSTIRKGANSTEFWLTEAKALEVARSRVKGARRACKVVDGKKNVRYATTTHPHYLMEYIVTTELGWEISEIGKEKAARTPPTVEALFAAIALMPSIEGAAVMKQIEGFLSIAKKK